MTVDADLSEAWFWLEKRERRALLALCRLPAELDNCTWRDFSVDQRMSIIRSMRELAELALACADALDLAHRSLNDPAAVLRDAHS